MTSPAAPTPPEPKVGFHKLIEEAAQRSAEFRRTASYALTMGVFPTEIVAYARGDLPDSERREFQALLVRSPWAMSRVAALVKARRNPDSLGSRILATNDDRITEEELAELLDRV